MRSARLLSIGALGATLLLPVGVAVPATAVAGGPFTATVTAKNYTNVRPVPVTVGKTNVPSGTSVNAYLVSEDGSPDPAKGDSRWRTLPTTLKLSDEDGAHTVYVWARATGGVVSERGSDTTFLDRLLPTIDTFETTPAQDDTPPVVSSRTVGLLVEASDPGAGGGTPTGSGVGKYAVVRGTTAPIVSDPAWVATPPTSFKLPKGNGVKTISVFAKDKAGNISLASTARFNLQVAAPSVTISLPSYTNVAKVPVTLVGTDHSGTGIAGYILKAADDAPLADDSGWKVKPATFTLSGLTGTKTVYAWAKDNSGTVSTATVFDTTVWDNTKPTADLTIDEDGLPKDTLDRTVDLVTSATDGPGSGFGKWALVNGTAAPTDAAAWKDFPIATTYLLPKVNGTKTVSLFVKDRAGNVSDAATDQVLLAMPAPTVTITIKQAVTRYLKVDVTLGKTDPAHTGIAGYFLSQTNSTPAANAAGWAILPTTFMLADQADGTKTIYAWVKDNNNTVSAVANDTVILDRTAPVATLSVAGTTLTVGGSDAHGIGFYAVVRTVPSTTIPSAPAFPNTAVWKSTANSAASTITLQSGSQRVTAFLRDVAGNVSVVDTVEDPDANSLVIVLP